MREWRYRLWLVVLSCCVPMAFAEAADKVSVDPVKESKAPAENNKKVGTPASSVAEVHTSPEEDYEAAVKAKAEGDSMRALDLYRRAAEKGHAEAQAQAAFLFNKSGYMEDAVNYYRKSAEQGNANGQFGLGASYLSGEGVKEDLIEARKWITLAAKQGHVGAISVMANAYIEGGLGLSDAERQGPEALHWIRLAADNNFRNAITELAEAYRSGKYGLVPDQKKADELDSKLNNKKEVKKKSSKIRR